MTDATFLVNDQFHIQIQQYFPAEVKTVAILLPAIGITIDKYQRLIAQLNDYGIAIITADYPGYADNYPKVSRQYSYNYADLIQQFIPTLVKYAQQFPEYQKTYLIGHSLGAHIATLYAQQHDCKVAGIATGNIHYKHWQGKARVQMLCTAYAFRFIVNALGYLPGDKIGFGKREAKGIMQDFARTVITGNYHHILEHYDKSTAENLFIQVNGDQWAPMASIRALADLFEQPHVEQITLPKHLKGNPHNVWLKAPEQAADKISQFILNEH